MRDNPVLKPRFKHTESDFAKPSHSGLTSPRNCCNPAIPTILTPHRLHLPTEPHFAPLSSSSAKRRGNEERSQKLQRKAGSVSKGPRRNKVTTRLAMQPQPQVQLQMQMQSRSRSKLREKPQVWLGDESIPDDSLIHDKADDTTVQRVPEVPTLR
jgi:hypothetical protein